MCHEHMTGEVIRCLKVMTCSQGMLPSARSTTVAATLWIMFFFFKCCSALQNCKKGRSWTVVAVFGGRTSHIKARTVVRAKGDVGYLGIFEACSLTGADDCFCRAKHSCCICYFQAKQVCSQMPYNVGERNHGRLQHARTCQLTTTPLRIWDCL